MRIPQYMNLNLHRNNFSIGKAEKSIVFSFLFLFPVLVNNSLQTDDEYGVDQFYPWFKFYFPLFQTHYHTLQCPKTKEYKI